MLLVLLRLVGVVVITALAGWASEACCGGHSSPVAVAFFGGVAFFFGTYLTGQGNWSSHGLLNRQTPLTAWRLAGLVLWGVAIVLLVVLRIDA